jgi:hypothetical protein
MIAVSHLAHGLLSAQAQQLGGTAVNTDFDRSADHAHSTPVVSHSPTARASTPAARVTHSAKPAPSPSPAQSSAPPPPSSGGKLLVSAGGSVMAICESAGAYLQYWSPNPGFEADDVVRGPAAVASVVFQNRTSGLVMQVSCSGGTPILHVSHDT